MDLNEWMFFVYLIFAFIVSKIQPNKVYDFIKKKKYDKASTRKDR
jgi:hypothetical protein